MSSTIVIGAPATGAKYWPRNDVMNALCSALENDHVIFPGPRRTGKTSILLRLAETPRAPGCAVLINAEKFSTASELIKGIADKVLTPSLKKRAAAAIKASASKVKGIKISVFGVDFHQAAEENWAEAADGLLQGLIAESKPVTIMIDEFSVFVNTLSKRTPDDTERLLRWFREWRQRLVDTQIRFLLTGSIGIDTVLRRLKLGDTVNDCRPVDMFPPRREDAREFLLNRARENDIPMTSELAEKMLHLIDPHWYYPLQLFLVEIQNWARAKNRPPQVTDLEAIYREQLVAKGNENLKHMWDKLGSILEPGEETLAKALLRALTTNPDGLSHDEMTNICTATFPPGAPANIPSLEYVLNVLRHDGYLIQESQGDQKTRFASNLLRDYWRRQHA